MRLRPSLRPRPTRYNQQSRGDHETAVAALCYTGTGVCAAPRCLELSPVITPDMDLRLYRDAGTGTVLGLAHARCAGPTP